MEEVLFKDFWKLSLEVIFMKKVGEHISQNFDQNNKNKNNSPNNGIKTSVCLNWKKKKKNVIYKI